MFSGYGEYWKLNLSANHMNMWLKFPKTKYSYLKNILGLEEGM